VVHFLSLLIRRTVVYLFILVIYPCILLSCFLSLLIHALSPLIYFQGKLAAGLLIHFLGLLIHFLSLLI